MTQTQANPTGAWAEPKATAVLVLADGRVFIAGGYQQTGLARTATYKAEFYNPATGGFEEAPDLGVPSGTLSSFTVAHPPAPSTRASRQRLYANLPIY